MNSKRHDLNLEQIQRLFFRSICYPTGIGDFVESLSPKERALFDSTFIGTENFPRNERMSLYADAYFYRLKDALESTFSVTSAGLGQERFHNCVTDYVLQCGSESPNLHHLGDRFPEYLESYDAPDKCPLQPDERARFVATALVERALARALEAADEELLTTPELAKVAPAAWQELQFDFVSSLELIDGGVAYEQAAHKNAPEQQDAPLVVWRKGHKVMTKLLGRREAELLRALKSGLTFAEACVAFESAGGSAADVAGTLVAWIERGWLATAR